MYVGTHYDDKNDIRYQPLDEKCKKQRSEGLDISFYTTKKIHD